MLAPKELKYEFKDKEGNSLMYLCVVSADGSSKGKVTLHFSEKRDPKEYQAAIQECKHFARMLQIPFTEKLDV